MNDVATKHDRDAKAESGKLAGPASYAAGLANSSGVFRAELPAVTEALAARCLRHCWRTSRPRQQTARFHPAAAAASALLPAATGALEGLSRSRHTRQSRRHHTPLANAIVSADPLGRAWDAHPTKGAHRP